MSVPPCACVVSAGFGATSQQGNREEPSVPTRGKPLGYARTETLPATVWGPSGRISAQRMGNAVFRVWASQASAIGGVRDRIEQHR